MESFTAVRLARVIRYMLLHHRLSVPLREWPKLKESPSWNRWARCMPVLPRETPDHCQQTGGVHTKSGSSGLKCESSKVSTLSSNRRMRFRCPRLPRLIPILRMLPSSHVTGPLRYRVERPLSPPATATSSGPVGHSLGPLLILVGAGGLDPSAGRTHGRR
ncbi:hypothetical protein BDP81DRAFT_417969 [Colletotrichum phormii]|uniref:Uncharacterized protein n=1 Tax=Colletotrichum phormii TaxID=359342 RepID=A0AAJ0ELM8_9PEZI|nr:uncharacterized protein BDP81DRAFT_417969 [Colletotrichum phormii]KAK1641065.1 hypothetical protein BDP81DRAFT_417969 [Colletotrichum phormii]